MKPDHRTPHTQGYHMLFAEELGPVGWSAVVGSILAAIVATATSIFNLRRSAKKEDVETLRADEDRIIAQHKDMYERAKKVWEDERAAMSLRLDLLEKRTSKLEQSNIRLRNNYIQEVARRRYVEGILKQHKIEAAEWDETSDEPLTLFDSDLPPLVPPSPSPKGE